MENATLRNDIQEAFCSFEVSKLLKEKGFDVPCPYWYNPQGIIIANMVEVDEDDTTITIKDILRNRPHVIEDKDCCFVPTHALAIEWININFTDVKVVQHFKAGKIMYRAYKRHYQNSTNWGYSEFVEADAALLYTLKNLIV